VVYGTEEDGAPALYVYLFFFERDRLPFAQIFQQTDLVYLESTRPHGNTGTHECAEERARDVRMMNGTNNLSKAEQQTRLVACGAKDCIR
jgi:hypothetical protein